MAGPGCPPSGSTPDAQDPLDDRGIVHGGDQAQAAPAAGRGGPLTIHGDDYPTRDGTCVRDYIHVLDLADAHVRALDALAAGHPGAVYNLGCGGEGYTVRQVVDVARRVTRVDIPVRVGPRRAGDPAVLVASAGRIVRDLGWRPARRTLDEMIGSAWRWLRARR